MDIDRSKLNVIYQETRAQGRHLSNIIYITLGFYISIIAGWIYLLGANLTDPSKRFLTDVVSVVLMLLLVMQAKVSRISRDNQSFIADSGNKNGMHGYGYSKFEVSGISGIADFFMYAVLTLIVTYVCLLNEPELQPYFVLVWFLVFFAIFGVLAGGKLIQGPIKFLSKPQEYIRIIFCWIFKTGDIRNRINRFLAIFLHSFDGFGKFSQWIFTMLLVLFVLYKLRCWFFPGTAWPVIEFVVKK